MAVPKVVRSVAFMKLNPDGTIDDTPLGPGLVGLRQSDLRMVCYELEDGTFVKCQSLEPFVPGDLWRVDTEVLGGNP
jgi:hypothetical protein